MNERWNLAGSFPRERVALLPTPLHALDALRAKLGPECPALLIKRDDLTGLALGGNKARKLEYLLADARAQGADTLITCGAAQSNHALQTAACAGKSGFQVRCVLYGDAPGPQVVSTGNLFLHSLLATPIRWVRMQPGETRPEQALRRGLAEEIKAVGRAGGGPYGIPTGGSTAIGALGYVRAIEEIKAQMPEDAEAGTTTVFFASGSGGTHAGMMVGAKLLGWPIRLAGVEIDPLPAEKDALTPFHGTVARLATETSTLLYAPHRFDPVDVELRQGFAGRAYGVPTAEAEEGIRLMAQTEGILLDPVYTGKAFAAMLHAVQIGEFSREDTVVFWHTGGAAGLFAGH